jgi:hypothetical protein
MRLLAALILVVALVACQTVTPPPPTPEPDPSPLTLFIDYYSIPQYVNYPTMTVHSISNLTTSPFANRVIRVACLQLGVYTYFQTAPLVVMPNQVTNAYAPYAGGYPMMVDASLFCTATVLSAAGQPEWVVRGLP